MEGYQPGNSASLLENGDEFFPRIIEVMDQAQHEILLETFIWEDDPVGRKIKDSVLKAAQRGVWVSVVVDGYGSFYFPTEFVKELTAAGVHFMVYNPQPKWILLRLNIFKRLHRKLLVVDGKTGFIGGINLAYNHSSKYGPDFKQDYAAELNGPIVTTMRRFLHEAVRAYSDRPVEFATLPELENDPSYKANLAMRFVHRDNDGSRTAIERQFLQQMRKARDHITIANPYFFPGYRLLRELRNAARRGVKVRILVQGKLGSPLARHGATSLYDFLVESGVEVYEYWERQLHGKIAAIDDDWSTIGSSNLDPLSLSLNLEANIFVRDRGFNEQLKGRILSLMDESKCRQVQHSWFRRRTLFKWFRTALIYHVFRHFPGLGNWFPPLEEIDKPSRWLNLSWRPTFDKKSKAPVRHETEEQ